MVQVKQAGRLCLSRGPEATCWPAGILRCNVRAET